MLKLISSFAALSAIGARDIYIDPEDRVLRDDKDRHVVFHGVNVVYKTAPYIPDDQVFDSQSSLTDKDIDDLVEWGFNFVRLGVMWEAVETSEGVYNDTYLDEVDKLITKLGDKGIYTLVDSHQDVLARQICGEGMPNFYARQIINNGAYCISSMADALIGPIMRMFGGCKSITDYGFRYDSDGLPLIEDCQQNLFFIYYTSPESFTLFRAFYYNDFGIQDKYVDFWAHVAQRLSGNKYVAGFDPFNEPMPSWKGIMSLIYEVLPGHMDKNELAPMYERLYEKYQAADADNIMMFEPAQFPDEIPNVVFPLKGFNKPPGGEIGSPNHVLNDHTYCCQLGPGICSETGEPQPDSAQKCYDWHKKRVGQRSADAERLGIPLIISEFGACMGSENCAREIDQVADVCDNELASWAYWEFKPFHDLTTSAGNRSEGFYANDGSLQTLTVKALSRTYIKSAQGTILNQKFISDSMGGYSDSVVPGTFQGSIKIDMSIDSPTEIHALNSNTTADYNWYPNGFDFTILQSEDSVEPEVHELLRGNTLYLQVTNQEFDGQTLHFKIEPKKSHYANTHHEMTRHEKPSLIQ